MHVTDWLTVRPNLQYIKQPGGVDEVDNALVAGIKIQTVFFEHRASGITVLQAADLIGQARVSVAIDLGLGIGDHIEQCLGDGQVIALVAQVVVAAVQCQGGAFLGADAAGEVAEVVGGQGDVGVEGLAHGLAVVPGLGDGEQFQVLLDAVGDLQQDVRVLETLPASMAFLCPNVNSYRRFGSQFYVPNAPSWGLDNRTVALRVPTGSPDAVRLEHRRITSPGTDFGAGGELGDSARITSPDPGLGAGGELGDSARITSPGPGLGAGGELGDSAAVPW